MSEHHWKRIEGYSIRPLLEKIQVKSTCIGNDFHLTNEVHHL